MVCGPYCTVRDISKQKKTRTLTGVSVFKSNIVGIGFAQNFENINDPADPKQAAGKQVQQPRTDLAFIELMRTKVTEKQAQEKGRPFVLCLSTAYDGGGCVCVGCICIVDDYVGLCSLLFNLFHLSPTFWTDDCVLCNFLSAMLTKLRFLVHILYSNLKYNQMVISKNILS